MVEGKKQTLKQRVTKTRMTESLGGGVGRHSIADTQGKCVLGSNENFHADFITRRIITMSPYLCHIPDLDELSWTWQWSILPCALAWPTIAPKQKVHRFHNSHTYLKHYSPGSPASEQDCPSSNSAHDLFSSRSSSPLPPFHNHRRPES